AKVFCEGLYNVVEMGKPLGELALQLKLQSGVSFYRSSRESLSGLGGEYLTGGCGTWGPVRGVAGYGSYKTFVEQKHRDYGAYTSAQATPQSVEQRVCNFVM